MRFVVLLAMLALALSGAGATAADQKRIVGTPRNDTIPGSRSPDRIDALAGNDVVTGRAGNDILLGRQGNDRLAGNAGNDVLKGNAGNDILRGGGGNDVLKGNAGRDIIRGDAGNDRIDGGAGPDTLAGGGGRDAFLFRSLRQGPDRIVDFAPDEADAIVLGGTLRGAALRYQPLDRNSTQVRVRARRARQFSDLAVLDNVWLPIDVWYGDRQHFGAPGEAQRWVNILGRVATDGLASLSFALNGGPAQPLALGPNGARLEQLGDFNVELDYQDLDPTAADDFVTIRADYQDGTQVTRQVRVAYQAGSRWPQNYTIDWGEVQDLQDAVQVVDGHWAFDATGVRPAVVGYDRVLALGDATWDSYTVRLTITIHSWESEVLGQAIWLGMQWGGHTNDPIPGQIPHAGYVPGATFMLQEPVVVLRPSEFFEDRIPANPQVGRGVDLRAGRTYNILVRNQRIAADRDLTDGLDRRYSIKIWEVGTPEPARFLISQKMVDQEPQGAFYLNAHYVDVTFGDVTVRRVGRGRTD